MVGNCFRAFKSSSDTLIVITVESIASAVDDVKYRTLLCDICALPGFVPETHPAMIHSPSQRKLE